jgi:hypothetical protein
MRRIARVALLAVSLAAPGAHAGWTGGGIAFESVRWETGVGPVAQNAPSAFADFVWSDRLAARLEVRGSGGRGAGESRLAPGASVAGLVRWRPSEAWLIQAGGATPSGLRNLDPPSLALGREVGEPILALPDPDPARGWRVLASTLWGVVPQRGVGIVLGVGASLAAAFDAQRGLALDPSDEARAQAAISGASGPWHGRLRLDATIEGRESVAGVEVRGGRTLYGAALEGGTLAGPVRLTLAGGFSHSGVCRVPHPEIYGVWLHPGPGSLGAAALAVEPARALPLGGGLTLRPALELSWRRVTPKSLPVADGSATGAGARLTIAGATRSLALGAAWESGRWRPWEGGARRAAETIHGWRVSLSLLWGRSGGVGE